MYVKTDRVMTKHTIFFYILFFRMCSALLPFIIKPETGTIKLTFQNFTNNVMKILITFLKIL